MTLTAFACAHLLQGLLHPRPPEKSGVIFFARVKTIPSSPASLPKHINHGFPRYFSPPLLSSKHSHHAETIQSNFDLGIWYALGLWPALSIAVTSNWGGPDSAGKRDWFAGAVSDLFDERPDTDQLDVEAVLLQVMQDEFDLNVEDESEIPVAETIMKLRKETADGDFSGVEAIKRRWEERGGKIPQNLQVVEHTNGEDDDESSEDESDDDDVEMGDAAPAPEPRQRQEPEVDDEGFTKVVGKKKR